MHCPRINQLNQSELSIERERERERERGCDMALNEATINRYVQLNDTDSRADL